MTTSPRAGKRGRIVDEQSVFINAPFDQEYCPLFAAEIAGITAMGLTPRCVLEVPSGGKNRLDRIYELIEICGASIHDLSRVTLSGPLNVPRFNMPFELGVAFALSKISGHRFFVFEAEHFRLQHTLSDLNGVDPQIHRASTTGVLGCILDCFGSPQNPVVLDDLQDLAQQLAKVVAKLQKKRDLSDPFSPEIFRQSVKAASQLARAKGLIR